MVMLALAGMTSCGQGNGGRQSTSDKDTNTANTAPTGGSNNGDEASSTTQGSPEELIGNCNTIADKWLDNFDSSADSHFIKDDAKQALNTLVNSILNKALAYWQDSSKKPDFGEDIKTYLAAHGTGTQTTSDEVSELTTKLSDYILDYIKQHPNLQLTKTTEEATPTGTEDKPTLSQGQDLNEIQQSISRLETQQNTLIKELKDLGNNGGLIICIIVLVLLTLIVSLIHLIKFAQKTNQGGTTTNWGEIRQQLEQIQLSLNTPRQYTGRSSSTQPNASIPTDIIAKLDSILSGIQKLEQKKDSMPPIPNQKLTSTSRTAYFGAANSDGKFGQEMSQHTPGYSLYECTITGNKAKFKPCDNMDAIRSYNNMSFAVDFIGVSRDKATKMIVVHEGEAEQRGSSWYVTKKAEVTLC